MTPEQLRQEAAHRAAAAVAEGLEQFANGWTPAEVLTVLHDAAGTVDDLRAQAAAKELLQKEARRRTLRIWRPTRFTDLTGGVA